MLPVGVYRYERQCRLFFVELFVEEVAEDVAEGGLFKVVVYFLDRLLGVTFFLGFFVFSLSVLGFDSVGEDTRVAYDNLSVLFVELDDLELEGLVHAGLCLVFLLKVASRSESFDAVRQGYGSALLVERGDGAFVNAVDGEEGLVDIPWVWLKLFVAQAEAVLLGVDFEDDDVDFLAVMDEVGRMFDLLGPAEVADVDKAVDAFFQFHEDAEVGEVADNAGVAAAYAVFLIDIEPWVWHELFDAEAHLASFAVEVQDDSFHFLTLLEEVLSAAEVLAPAHLADVDKAFYAGDNLDESAIFSHDNDFTFNLVAFFKFWVEGVPWVRSELFETELYAMLGFVEVEGNDVELLVDADNLFWVVDAAPAEVGDVDKAVNAAEVDKHAVLGDVLDGAFQHLTFFEVADNLSFLSFDDVFDKSLVADDDIFVFVVDLNNFEFHLFADVNVVVAYLLDVDLAAWEECVDVLEHADDETTFGAAFHEAFDDLLVVVSLVDALP